MIARAWRPQRDQVTVPEVPAAQGVGDGPQVFVAQPDRHPPPRITVTESRRVRRRRVAPASTAAATAARRQVKLQMSAREQAAPQRSGAVAGSVVRREFSFLAPPALASAPVLTVNFSSHGNSNSSRDRCSDYRLFRLSRPDHRARSQGAVSDRPARARHRHRGALVLRHHRPDRGQACAAAGSIHHLRDYDKGALCSGNCSEQYVLLNRAPFVSRAMTPIPQCLQSLAVLAAR
jgi:hypothetical protein